MMLIYRGYPPRLTATWYPNGTYFLNQAVGVQKSEHWLSNDVV
jgi:hypothetical protein